MNAPEEFGLREMLADAAEQTEEWNRAQRQEYHDAHVEHDPRDDAGYPDHAELARENAEIRRERAAAIAEANRRRASR